jgi:hypothetical protein
MNPTRKTKPALWTQFAPMSLKRSGIRFKASEDNSGTKPRLRLKNRPIRSRTAKRAYQEVIYRRRVKVWLVGQICQVRFLVMGQHVPATQNHHSHGRRGRLLLYEPWWCPVSDFGQVWIHDNPIEARKLGLICEIGKWNLPPKI